MAIADYLNKLVQLKNDLITTLRNKGIEVSDDEKLNTLVPKVEEVEGEQNVEWVDNVNGGLSYYFTESGGNIRSYTNIHIFFKKISLPYGITSIAESFFYNCKDLESIVIPSTVSLIGQGAFHSCTGLKNIILPEGLVRLGETSTYTYGVFTTCTALESIVIPSTVSLIGKECFYNCINLANIYYTGSEEQWNAITKGTSWNYNMGSNVTGGTVIHYNYVPE